MQKWEYFQLEQALTVLTDSLNSLGRQGWELLGAYEAKSTEKSPLRNVFVFKRLVESGAV